MKVMPKLTRWHWLLPWALFLTACSEAPKSETAKTAEKPPEALTGRQAFQRMYPQARAWAMDVQLFQLRSINLASVKAEKGQAGAWQAIFVSASKGKARTYS